MISWVVEEKLARSSRPGYGGERGVMVTQKVVDAWIREARSLGIRSIICLLNDEHLCLYDKIPGGLIGYYTHLNFGLRRFGDRAKPLHILAQGNALRSNVSQCQGCRPCTLMFKAFSLGIFRVPFRRVAGLRPLPYANMCKAFGLSNICVNQNSNACMMQFSVFSVSSVSSVVKNLAVTS